MSVAFESTLLRVATIEPEAIFSSNTVTEAERSVGGRAVEGVGNGSGVGVGVVEKSPNLKTFASKFWRLEKIAITPPFPNFLLSPFSL